MITLEIDNKNIDLAGARIVLNKSAYVLTDWLSRFITFSERLIVPRIYFMRFGEYYNFKVKDNGQILFNGNALLLAENSDISSEVQLLDSSNFLFNKMQDFLTALNLDQYDFIFNTTEYSNRKVLTSSVWLWAAANFHQNRNLSNNLLSGNLAFYRPFLSVKRLTELIFNTNGWNYNLSDNANFFDNLILSSNHNNFYFCSYEKKFNFYEAVISSFQLPLDNYDFIKNDVIDTVYILKMKLKTKLRLRGYIEADNFFIISIIGESSASTNSLIQSFVIQKGYNYYDFTSNLFSTVDATYDINISILGTGAIEFTDFYIYTQIQENDFGNISDANFIDFKVKTYDNTPQISQVDLFKNSLIFCGGFFTTENFKKQININSLTELSKLSALDWSVKFVENSDRKTQLTGLGKRNRFNYNNSDSKPFGTGNSFFDINNNTYPDLVDLYNSIFEASPEVEIDSELMFDSVIYSDVERINTSNVLIGYYQDIGIETLARFEALNGDSVLNDFYLNFISALQKSEFYEANFNLNKSDFYNFDFTRLIYISQLKSCFYVISIDGYIEDDLTKLTLLKY